MKKILQSLFLAVCALLLVSCAGGLSYRGGYHRGFYDHYHGYGPWWGGRDRYIVVPDDSFVDATPLPSEPDMMPDIGFDDF